MEDNEIVKALECCIDSNCCKENCPIFDERDSLSLCTSKLSRYALDLINRLQAEKEKLQKNILKYEDIFITLQAENERLNTYLDVIGYSTDKIKAEAYKEFAELIKKDFENPYIQKLGLDYVDFLKGVVDNRLKRTVGEDK